MVGFQVMARLKAQVRQAVSEDPTLRTVVCRNNLCGWVGTRDRERPGDACDHCGYEVRYITRQALVMRECPTCHGLGGADCSGCGGRTYVWGSPPAAGPARRALGVDNIDWSVFTPAA